MPTVSSYSFLSVYSCVVSSSLCIANLNDRLFHSRPSLPICPLLTCISQSAQSLSSRTVSFYSFRSLQLDHIANLDDRKSLLPRNHFPLDRHQSNDHPGTEEDSDLFRIDQVGSYFFYANGKFLLFPSHALLT